MNGCPATNRSIRTSSRVETLFSGSADRSMILAAYSTPVSFSMHLLTVELIPLQKKKYDL